MRYRLVEKGSKEKMLIDRYGFYIDAKVLKH